MIHGWQGPMLAHGGGPLSLLGGQHPAAINLNLAPDPPEDAGALSKNLQELAQLWQDWHGLGLRQLPAEQVSDVYSAPKSGTTWNNNACMAP